MILKPWFTLQVKFQQLRHLLNNLKFLFLKLAKTASESSYLLGRVVDHNLQYLQICKKIPGGENFFNSKSWKKIAVWVLCQLFHQTAKSSQQRVLRGLQHFTKIGLFQQKIKDLQKLLFPWCSYSFSLKHNRVNFAWYTEFGLCGYDKICQEYWLWFAFVKKSTNHVSATETRSHCTKVCKL